MLEVTVSDSRKKLLTGAVVFGRLLVMLGLVDRRWAGPVQQLRMHMLIAEFDPSSVYAGVAGAFEAALVVAASLTAALIIYRWVRRVFGR